MLLLLNGGDDAVRFTLPALDEVGEWVCLLDTAEDARAAAMRLPGDKVAAGGEIVPLAPHSLQLLRRGDARRRRAERAAAVAASRASGSFASIAGLPTPATPATPGTTGTTAGHTTVEVEA